MRSRLKSGVSVKGTTAVGVRVMPPRGPTADELVFCPHCRAIYQMKRVHVPGIDEGEFLCADCGKEVMTWRGRYVPFFLMVKGTTN